MSGSGRGVESASGVLVAGSGLGVAFDWRDAVERALDQALEPLQGDRADLLLLFASFAFNERYSDLLAVARARSGAAELVGCSASGVIGGDRGLGDEPGGGALALKLPTGSLLTVRYVECDDLDEQPDWTARLDVFPRACSGFLVLADPFTTDVAALIGSLEQHYPGATIMGGLATGAAGVQHTAVFFGDQVAATGAVVIGLGGTVGLRPVVSQGCEPIGQPWTITDATGHVVKGIGGRPAYQVLVETVQQLDPDKRQRAGGNLLVGLAMDEYRDEFRRGDFLIRNLMGADPASGAIAIAAQVGVGQTVQFQIRDARAADEELRHMVGAEAGSGAGAALLFACNGRGVGLFGTPDHDARTVRDLLGPLPLAGLFCNGEIGPVGVRTYIHGFTASLALISAAD